jgi:hypothetical protein
VSGHVWSSMGGSFNVSEGTGSGTIDSADDPTGTRGSWSAGGTGRPFPRQAAGHSHSA